MSTSFKQFKYCEVCRTNHAKGKSHLYSKKHQDKLQHILNSSLKKVKACRKLMDEPCIHDGLWGAQETFWCYFCVAQIDKHQQLVTVAVKNGHMIYHLGSIGHHTKTSEFWTRNHLNKLDMVKHLISEDDHKKFIAKCELAVKKFEEQKELLKFKEAERIRKLEYHRSSLIRNVPALHRDRKTSACVRQPAESFGSQRAAPVKFGGMRTVSAQGQGLTCIAIKESDHREGNIFSGATPPWQQDDSPAENDTSSSIGPTVEDYEKHLARLKKQKLPATRVGATFDGRLECSATWLPSFGRVWNKNRRTDSQHYFKKNFWPGDHSNQNQDNKDVQRPLVSYKRKRNMPETVTSERSMEHHESDNMILTRDPVQNVNHYRDSNVHHSEPMMPSIGEIYNYSKNSEIENVSTDFSVKQPQHNSNPYNIQIRSNDQCYSGIAHTVVDNSVAFNNHDSCLTFKPVTSHFIHNNSTSLSKDSDVAMTFHDHIRKEEHSVPSSGQPLNQDVISNGSGYKKKCRRNVDEVGQDARIQISNNLL